MIPSDIKSQKKSSLLIYGGSFDPIHDGHLQTALSVQHHLQVEHIVFLPCKIPLLKKNTQATSEQRIAMLQLALQPYPKFTLDLREIKRDTPSYMVETLESFRKEHGPSISLILLLGLDTFLQLPLWHNWMKIIHLSHILIIPRLLNPQPSISPALHDLLVTCETKEKSQLLFLPHGKIYHFHAGSYYDISSTQIRQAIAHGENIADKIPEAVYEYIKRYDLYLNRNPMHK